MRRLSFRHNRPTQPVARPPLIDNKLPTRHLNSTAPTVRHQALLVRARLTGSANYIRNILRTAAENDPVSGPVLGSSSRALRFGKFA
ncbi:hypothetical protein BU16DRAFT_325203 [Lophium mytilinum]|uniref:Uncharacterized protein n=1 Tax=Lophium mytilinum TaxID=390894 RepID=A0A6A6R0L1_9PEZI|nr:hypothetical protein BU16DRAFT_325203 [Lophium mytilinum]